MSDNDLLEQLLSEADLAVHEHHIRQQSSKYSSKSNSFGATISNKELISSTLNKSHLEEKSFELNLMDSTFSSVYNDANFFDVAQGTFVPPLNFEGFGSKEIIANRSGHSGGNSLCGDLSKNGHQIM